jgi:hypothetical protein
VRVQHDQPPATTTIWLASCVVLAAMLLGPSAADAARPGPGVQELWSQFPLAPRPETSDTHETIPARAETIELQPTAELFRGRAEPAAFRPHGFQRGVWLAAVASLLAALALLLLRRMGARARHRPSDRAADPVETPAEWVMVSEDTFALPPTRSARESLRLTGALIDAVAIVDDWVWSQRSEPSLAARRASEQGRNPSPEAPRDRWHRRSNAAAPVLTPPPGLPLDT